MRDYQVAFPSVLFLAGAPKHPLLGACPEGSRAIGQDVASCARKAPSRSARAEPHSPHRPACSLGYARPPTFPFGIVPADARTLSALDARLGIAYDLARQQSRGASFRVGFGVGEPVADPRELASAARPGRQGRDAGILDCGQPARHRQQRRVLLVQDADGFPHRASQGGAVPHRQ